MSANEFGHLFKMLSFGESHGHSMGVVVDGCPAGVEFDADLLQAELRRRRPGQNDLVSDRQELDEPMVLSGVFEGKTLGTPIAIVVKNKDAQSAAYDEIKSQPRTGHADDTWKSKFIHVDHRGGGRSSGRETIARVMAGSVARMFLNQAMGRYQVSAFTKQIGPLELTSEELRALKSSDVHPDKVDGFPARFPFRRPGEVEQLLKDAKSGGQSYGGQVQVWIDGLPKGLGEPVFHKFKSEMTRAFMSLGAVSAVELGDGISAATAEGSEYHRDNQGQYGGIRGGITTGERVGLSCYFKPTSSVLDVAKKGRHDPCIVPRAIPVLEAMAHMVIADFVLWARTNNI